MKRGNLLTYVTGLLVSATLFSCSNESENSIPTVKQTQKVQRNENSASVLPDNEATTLNTIEEVESGVSPSEIIKQKEEHHDMYMKLQKILNEGAPFTENNGQLEKIFQMPKSKEIGTIRFYNKVSGGVMYYGEDGVSYALMKHNIENLRTGAILPKKDRFTSISYNVHFQNKNPDVEIVGLNKLDSRLNFIKGKNQEESIVDIANYESVMYKGLYNNIDLHYYRNGRIIKYDVILNPGADVSDVSMDYTNVKSLQLDKKGNLNIETDWGIFTDDAPVTYQEIDGKKEYVKSKYKVEGNVLGFEILEKYDRTIPLIIDPPTTSWATYLTNAGLDNGYVNDVGVDNSGNVYITGWGSILMPVTSTIGTAARADDFIIMKLSSDGTTLNYATYITGNSAAGGDQGFGIQINSSGEAFVGGYVTSTDFPTASAVQGSNGGAIDIVFLKLNAAGTALTYSSYYGGTGNDAALDIAMQNDTVYMTGVISTNGFATAGVYDNTYSSGFDTYVMKINPNGSLNFFTYYGDTGDDMMKGIDVDNDGDIYISGSTTSSANIATVGAHDVTYGGGSYDAFVAKFSKDGTSLVYGSYLGECCGEWGGKVRVNSRGEAAVILHADHMNFGSKLAHQSSPVSGSDGALILMGADGDSLVFSTWIAGNGADNGTKGRIFNLAQPWRQGDLDLTDSVIIITFETNSTNMATQDPLNFATVNANHATGTHTGLTTSSFDSYVAIYKYNPTYYSSNLKLHFATYFGGVNGTSYPTGGIIIDGSSSCFYLSSSTHENDWPTTAGVYQTSSTAANDQVNVAKICDADILPVDYLSFSGNPIDGGVSLNWITANEVNNDYFEVLRSTDGKYFQSIGTVQGSGNASNASYSFLDEDPISGTVYYRLRQVDYDGAEEYSSIIAVYLDDVLFDIRMKRNKWYVMSEFEADEKVKVSATTVNGKILVESDYIAPDSFNEFEIPLPAETKGMIILKATSASKSSVKKVVIK